MLRIIVLSLLSLISCVALQAQNTLSDLSLDELGHVTIHPKSAGILEKRPYDTAYVYVGLIVPYSTEKEHSLEVKKAIELAIDDINSGGGVLGKKLMLVTADDADNNDLTVHYTDSLLHTYKIAALIGPTSSRRLIHLAKTYLPQHPTLVISPSASSEEISHLNDHDLVWRTTPSDEHQARNAAQFITRDLKKNSAAILSIDDVYGNGLCAGFKKAFKGKVVSEVRYNPRVDLRTFDFAEKLNVLFKDKPEVVYLIAGSNDAAILTHKIREGKYITGKYRPVFFTVDALKEKSFIDQCDRSVTEGMYGTAIASVNANRFNEAFRTKYGRYPVSSYCERAYDIAYILALAMEKSRSTHYDSIRMELRDVTTGGEKTAPGDFANAKIKLQRGDDIYFEGASGAIRFDKNGDLTTGTFEIWKIEQGKYETQRIIRSGTPEQ